MPISLDENLVVPLVRIRKISLSYVNNRFGISLKFRATVFEI